MTTHTGQRLRLRLRALRPDDAERLEAGFVKLSDDSRYLSFFTPLNDLNDNMLDHFVNPDQVDHIAIGTLDPASSRGTGVARLFRSDDDPTAAEFTIAVIDEYHSNGIGTLLLDALGVAAARVGIETLTADVLSTNTSMLALVARRTGSRQQRDDDPTSRASEFRSQTSPHTSPTPIGENSLGTSNTKPAESRRRDDP